MDHVPPARQHDADGPAPGRSSGRLGEGLLLILCLTLAAGFSALGVWQVERLAWKRQLIETVEARLAAPPAPPPLWNQWSVDKAYTRVSVSGVFLHDRETPVQAVTEAGPGWWVMTPLRTGAGVILVNRGFAPTELRAPSRRPSGQVPGTVRVIGLLRATEPKGGFLRSNAPAAGRWYSRDVQAIARSGGVSAPVAPFFIDADATPNPGGYPVGGMTVVRFRNDHLAYALTWFALAVLSGVCAVIVFRHMQGRSRPDRLPPPAA
jgi:surfeit locus 1 family protein